MAAMRQPTETTIENTGLGRIPAIRREKTRSLKRFMFGPLEFRELVSGRRRGLGPSLVRGLLSGAEVPYALAMRLRNRGYDLGWPSTHRAGVPVISVGNLTLGGTGKTPMVKWIAGWLRKRGVRVAIVSRGYGAKGGAKNDEALELEQSLPDVPHVQNPDRVAASLRAAEEFDCQVVLLDDGFQHRRLARDLDIVLLDAWEPLGFGHVFPRGTLREPVQGLRRADIVCLSRADQISAAERESLRERVAQIAPHAAWCQLAVAASGLRNVAGQSLPLETIRGRRVAAFCGIGNPKAFRRTLDETGCEIALWREFSDHHAYGPADLTTLQEAVAASGAEMVLCTHKDLVKLSSEQLAGRPLWAVTAGMNVLTGLESLEEALARVSPRGSA
jgi:tetraacyldisaccharide 4'-kinase